MSTTLLKSTYIAISAQFPHFSKLRIRRSAAFTGYCYSLSVIFRLRSPFVYPLKRDLEACCPLTARRNCFFSSSFSSFVLKCKNYWYFGFMWAKKAFNTGITSTFVWSHRINLIFTADASMHCSWHCSLTLWKHFISQGFVPLYTFLISAGVYK